ATGALALVGLPATLAGYVTAIVVITAGYGLFQTANNTGVMAGAGPDQRGVTSGMLNLSRNLGLITGASVMGAVFSAQLGDVAEAVAHRVAGRRAVRVGLVHARDEEHLGGGTVFMLLAMAEDEREPSLAEAAREAVIAAITTDTPALERSGPAAAAVALRR